MQAQLGQVEAQEVAQAKAHDFKIYTEVVSFEELWLLSGADMIRTA